MFVLNLDTLTENPNITVIQNFGKDQKSGSFIVEAEIPYAMMAEMQKDNNILHIETGRIKMT